MTCRRSILTQGQEEMAPRPREPFARKVFKGVLFLELAAVFGVYGLFHAMNSSRDFRSKMDRRLPSVLEAYYKSNEWAGVYGIRETDREAWSAKKE
ncbi:protein CEBPZOS-like [Clupea harengus]|uniref:Protein CEBPZOS-like n=1 Tax=Clupea harengus TaxID=7950 RepID=A0A8M1KFW3_CLUHA|nr:protein CEBPZOS-like [Clupea harengus]